MQMMSTTKSVSDQHPNQQTVVNSFDPLAMPFPANVTRTVNLQHLPETHQQTTQMLPFQASRALSKTSSATMRQSARGRSTEMNATTAMYRNSDAFSASHNFQERNTGIDSMRGTNAITRGLGAIDPEAVSSNPSNMTLSYRRSETRSGSLRASLQGIKGNPILDMGHFMDPSEAHDSAAYGLPNGRQSNYRGAVTTASRAEALRMQRNQRPHTVAEANSPARGANFRGATKIAMNKMNTMLRSVSTTHGGKEGGKGKSKPKVKIHKSLGSHVFNKKPQTGMISSSLNKDYFNIAKERPSWQDMEPADQVSVAKSQPELIQLESMGPVSWSSDDIRMKWRDETEREKAWKMSRAAKIAAEEMQEKHNYIVPHVELHRHPIHTHYWSYLKLENEMASKRSLLRAKNRRFALDVHTVWLTNLPHLPEFQSGLELYPEPVKERSRGLKGARDVDNIKKARSQVQSVSHKRVIQGAFFDEEERIWKTDLTNLPPPPPTMFERPVSCPVITPLISNEAVSIEGSDHPLLLSIHRLQSKTREYYKTAAVLVNGRWEIPASGGSEQLEPGLSVNLNDDILKLSPKKMAEREVKKKESEEGLFGKSFEEAETVVEGEEMDSSVLPGSTLETMKLLDSWSAATGKAFVDKVDKTEWR